MSLMTKRVNLYNLNNHLLVIMLLFFTACNSGGGGGDGDGVVPLKGFSYDVTSINASIGNAITKNSPVFTKGEATQFSIFPSFSRNLNFNTETGMISGTPEQISSRKSYIITAKNPANTITTSIELSILPLAKFCTRTQNSGYFINYFKKDEFKTIALDDAEKPDIVYGNNYFLITSDTDRTITIFDAISNDEVKKIEVIDTPVAAAFGNGLFGVVLNKGDSENGSLIIIDGDSLQTIKTVAVQNGPRGIAYGNKRFVVMNSASSNVTIYNTVTTTKTDLNISGLNHKAIGFGNNLFLTIGEGLGPMPTGSIIDANTDSEIATIVGVSFDSFEYPKIIFGNNCFFLTENTNLWKIDAYSPYSSAKIINSGYKADIAFGNNRVAVTKSDSDQVDIIDAQTLTKLETIDVDMNPKGIAFDNNVFAVTHKRSNKILFLDVINDEKSSISSVNFFDENHKIVSAKPKFTPTFCLPVGFDSSSKVVLLDAHTDGILNITDLDGTNLASVGYGNNLFLVATANTTVLYIKLMDPVTYKLIAPDTSEFNGTWSGNSDNYTTLYHNNIFAVLCNDEDKVILINSNDNSTQEISLQNGDHEMACGNGYFAVTNNQTNEVALINTNNNNALTRIDTGNSPGKIKYGNGYFCTVNSGNISLINTNSNNQVSNIQIENPEQLEYGNGFFTVSHYVDDDYNVILINTNNSNSISTVHLEEKASQISFSDNQFAIFCKSMIYLIRTDKPGSVNTYISLGFMPVNGTIIFAENRVILIDKTSGIIRLYNPQSGEQTKEFTIGEEINTTVYGNYRLVFEHGSKFTVIYLLNPAIIATHSLIGLNSILGSFYPGEYF